MTRSNTDNQQGSLGTLDALVKEERQHPLPVTHMMEYWGSAFGRARLKRRLDLIRKTFTEGCILEIGSGVGLLAQAFANDKVSHVALDLHQEILAYGLERQFIETGRAVLGDAHRLPFPDNSFDGVCGNAILHHLDPVATLTECRRILKPGGRLLFMEPNMRNPYVYLVKNWDWLGQRYHETPGETAFRTQELLEYAQKAGLTESSVTPFDFCVGPAFALPLVKAVEPTLEASPLKHWAISLILLAQA